VGVILQGERGTAEHRRRIVNRKVDLVINTPLGRGEFAERASSAVSVAIPAYSA